MESVSSLRLGVIVFVICYFFTAMIMEILR